MRPKPAPAPNPAGVDAAAGGPNFEPIFRTEIGPLVQALCQLSPQGLGLAPREVAAAFLEAHPIMEKYVFSGLANRLMLAESDIVTSALLRLMGLGVPALPVHDSLIAPKRHREQVKRVMEDAYREHTGFSITVE